jgi:hypothetical protein
VGVFLRSGDELIPMRELVYQAESVLERLMAESPALLAGDDSGTRRLLLLGRTDDQAGPDYAFLDQEGIPTLVEVTRSADPEASSELVGQMVDYAGWRDGTCRTSCSRTSASTWSRGTSGSTSAST